MAEVDQTTVAEALAALEAALPAPEAVWSGDVEPYDPTAEAYRLVLALRPGSVAENDHIMSLCAVIGEIIGRPINFGSGRGSPDAEPLIPLYAEFVAHVRRHHG